MKNLSDQLSTCLETANKALLSNKADTENALELFGAAQEQIEIISKEKENLKIEWDLHKELDAEREKRLQNSYITGNILASLPGAMIMTKGFIDLAMSNAEQDKVNLAWKWIAAGALTEIGFHVVYQSGHWIFRVW